jgi:dipeptidyl aminopeptidase/acylaminoacyl peptidase
MAQSSRQRALMSADANMGFSPDASEVWLAGSVPDKRRLMPLMGGAPRVFLRDHVVAVTWSPDGAGVAFHTGDPGDPIFVADRTGANARQIFGLSAGWHNHFPTWSPDGRWIYFVSGNLDLRELDLWRIAPSGGQPDRLTRHPTDVGYIAPLDPRTILYVAPDQDGSGPWLWAVDVERKVSRRVSSGLERYTSVAASADGRRLVATVANPTASLWSVPFLDRSVEERDAKPFSFPTVRALAPRLGGADLYYLSASGAGDGLWRYHNIQAQEIWKGGEGPLPMPPAISADGQRIAVVLKRQGRLRPCWSPDGKSIVTGGNDPKGAGLFKVPVDGGTPVRLVSAPASIRFGRRMEA